MNEFNPNCGRCGMLNSRGFCSLTACRYPSNVIAVQPVKVPFVPKPMTNADRIRGMTDEELAFWMTTNVTCCSCPVDLDACHNFEISGKLSCEEILLNWLKAPVEVQG